MIKPSIVFKSEILPDSSSVGVADSKSLAI